MRPSSVQILAVRSSNRDDRGELTVGEPEGLLRSTKLNAITGSEFALLGAEDLNSRKPLRRVIKAPAIIQNHRESPSVRVCALNHCVSALLYLHPPAAARETHDIADLVVSGVAALRAGQVAIHQDRVRYFQRIDQTVFLQRLPDNSIKILRCAAQRCNRAERSVRPAAGGRGCQRSARHRVCTGCDGLS